MNKIISIKGNYNECINFITDKNIVNYLFYTNEINTVFLYELYGKEERFICMLGINRNATKNETNLQKSISSILNKSKSKYFRLGFG